MLDIEKLRQDPTSRRTFLTRMSAAGLGTVAATMLAGCGGGDSNSNSNNVSATVRSAFPNVGGSSDNTVVLNYAYSLEILESALYLIALNAASGLPLTTPLNANSGAYSKTVGNGSVSTQLAGPGYLYLVQYAYVEAAHRDFLKTVLGADANPVVPASGNYKFPNGPGTDLGTILSNVYPLEETGTRAYLGAVPYLTDNGTLQVAGTIYSTECRHSAALAYILGLDPGPSRNIAGVPAGEQEVPGGATVAANVFEKLLAPSVVLTAASGAYFA